MVENYVIMMYPKIIYISYIETSRLGFQKKNVVMDTNRNRFYKFIMSLKIYFYCVTGIFLL